MSSLIVQLGNRDLQLSKDFLLDSEKKEWFTDNQDNDLRIISKQDKTTTFYKRSKVIYQAYDEFEDHVTFPMVELALESIDSLPERVILSTSEQKPEPDRQDCAYIARFALKFFKKRFPDIQWEIDLFEVPPVDFAKLADHYTFLLDQEKEKTERVFLSNSGGTPDMRVASHFAGMFRNITFISANARTGKVSQRSFKQQERHVLKNMVSSMLTVHDYEGIKRLNVDDEIKRIADQAISNYNFDIEENKDKTWYERSKEGIGLLMENMRICFDQGRYADVLGRFYRLEEAIWHHLFYEQLKNDDILNVKNEKVKYESSSQGGKMKKKGFSNMLSSPSAFENILTQNYPEILYQEKNGTFYKNYPKVSIHSGKNTFYFFFKSLDIYRSFTVLFGEINNHYDQKENPVNKLRNKSILGHGLEGISFKDIQSVFGDFQSFYDNLSKLIKEELDIERSSVFMDLEKEIKDQIHAPHE